MLRRGLLAVLLAGVLALASPAGAQCQSSLLLTIEVPGVTTFYYDDRTPKPPTPGFRLPLPEIWIYQEANLQAGLQRGGSQWILAMVGLGDLDTEICIESQNPDRLWL